MKIQRSGSVSNAFHSSLRKILIAQGKEPWQMTQQDFMDYHYTGGISEDAYENYHTREGIEWLGPKSKHPVLHSKMNVGGKEIEFRQRGEKLQYVKLDENEEIVRDENGMAVMMTDEEMKQKGYPMYDQSITAFDDQGPIGWVSNEFGVPGVWVIDEYQKKGIGTHLLSEFMKMRKPDQKLGQMTGSGRQLAKAYHRKLIQEALEQGKPVPPEVLKDYPELQPQEVAPQPQVEPAQKVPNDIP